MSNTEKIITNVSETLLNQLYNREVKETFLRDYLEDENTRLSYAVFLVQCAEYEKLIEKDMYLWSSKDILDMFGNKFTNSHTSLRALFTIAKQYLNWSTERGFNATGSNPFSSISFKNDILPMLNMRGLEDRFLTEEQVWGMENKSINYQDFACIILPYYFIRGNKYSEIQNLTIDDVDGVNNTVKLTNDDGSVRVIEVPRKVIEVINKAWGESEYNRRGKEGHGSRVTANLKPSNYILRPTTVKGTDFLSAQSICSRAKKLLKDCGYEHLSINDIYNSSKLNMLKEIEKEKGQPLEVEDFKKVQFESNSSVENYSNIMALYNIINPKTE